MVNKRKLVVIGNGMAGVRAVEEILKIDSEAFDITIFGKEPHPNYNRILLSKVLQGDTTVESVTLNNWQWYKDNGIILYTDEQVVQLVAEEKYVVTAKRRKVYYDDLIIATGSIPFMLPLPGAEKEGVTAFRDISDCEKMIEYSAKYKKAIVIGGGLLGLEAARGLLNLGMKVDVVHIAEHLMERQLDSLAAEMLRKELENQGMNFLLQASSVEITGEERVDGIRFADGSWREADLVVMAVGVRPNTEIAADTEIEVNRAIVVDDYMRTNLPNVYAVGECVEHRGSVYGLVAPLYEQGKVLAAVLCGQSHEGYQGSVLSTQLKVSGVDVFSAGEFTESEETVLLKWYDGVKNTYRKVVLRNQEVVGAVMFGDTSTGSNLLNMIQQKAGYEEVEKEFAATAVDVDGRIAAMADHDLVCACNGVTKGTITNAICDEELDSVDDVKACTKASSSCGGCRPLVADILDYVQRCGVATKIKQPMCTCTTADHSELIEMIKESAEDTQEAIMLRLGWSTVGGCEICRPAIRYYMGVHSAKIPEIIEEKTADGTYMVSPRLHGGLIGTEQLLKITEIVKKYNIPLVKLATGPRMELYGIRQQEVAAVRTELALEVHSYGYGLRAVSTCSGSRYGKNAMQDSLLLGFQLEKELESSRFPTEITIGISAGVDDQAKARREDISLIGAPGGWELYGGSERFYTAMTMSEALSMTEALLSLYQRTAFYLEELAEWVVRTGILSIREEMISQKAARRSADKKRETEVALSHAMG
ncbi:NAD(P)/FAD-dependent oxidoreductase [Planococcus sp. CPCC 101016]|uniref:nitrite reductase large subunit NirB n=1 Tax=Planococcus sp. CPCC 101016 TaxID=2599617 RepID=UPI0011B36E43|nr:nitrite reductase large subunit NirB [Planococcus sp. CPCC 101016]TWT06443.1 NAD(P)/FAD-dependent oxidoreductase [Planococcus sp. CPCC 101016]